MGYREMTLKRMWKTNSMLKDLMHTDKGKDYVARLAAQVSRTDYSQLEENPFRVIMVFKEEIRRIKGDKPKNPKEWIKRVFYKNMINNAIKLSYKIAAEEQEKNLYRRRYW